ncbi:MAG: CAP domain-containing protein [bacterium]|nr:CAP domain-containing protein [bacterium]
MKQLILALLIAFPAALTAQPSQAFSHGDPTPQEQWMLELINRARANPAEEGVRLMDTPDPSVQSAYQYFQINKSATKQAFTTYPARAPLAFHAKLIQAARGHTADMIANNFQGHTSSNGDQLTQRYTKAGYASQGQWGENVAAYSESVWYGHCGLMVDWGTQNQIDLGHRENLLNFKTFIYTEIGIGITNSGGGLQSGTVGPWVITQDFGIRSDRYILGVVYNDANSNGFYDIGEGLAGVKVSPATGTYFATTSTSGGYAIPYTGAGSVTVTASGGPLGSPMTKTITFNNENIKVDFAPAPQAPSAVTLLTPANNAMAQDRNAISLSWNAASFADDYEIHVASAASFAPAAIVYNESQAGTSVTIDVPKCNTKYYWRVRARNAINPGAWSSVFSFTTSGVNPTQPLTASPKGATSADIPNDIVFTWGAFASATNYHVRVSSAATFTTNLVDDSTITSAEYRMNAGVPGLSNGTWYWTVRTENNCGWSNWSTPTQFALTITDVADDVATSGFSVSPNPFTTSSVVRFAPSATATIRVSTLDGRLVESVSIDGTSGVFALGTMQSLAASPTGAYVVTVISGTSTRTALLVK